MTKAPLLLKAVVNTPIIYVVIAARPSGPTVRRDLRPIVHKPTFKMEILPSKNAIQLLHGILYFPFFFSEQYPKLRMLIIDRTFISPLIH